MNKSGIAKKVFYGVFLVIFIVLYWGYKYQVQSYKNVYTVTRGSITTTVSETGRLIGQKEFDLSYGVGAVVGEVVAKVGQEVKKDEILVKLEKKELEIQLNQARDRRSTAQAKLNQLLAGATVEDIRVYETAVTNAETSVANAETAVQNAQVSLKDAMENLNNVTNKATVDLSGLYSDARNVLTDSYAKADNAVNGLTDEMFFNESTSSPKLIFSTKDSQLTINVQDYRVLSGQAVDELKVIFKNTNNQQIESDLRIAEDKLYVVQTFLSLLYDAITESGNLAQATIDTYQSNIDGARTGVIAAISSTRNQRQSIFTQQAINQSAISAAKAKVNTAQSALKTAEGNLEFAQGVVNSAKRNLVLKQANPREVDIAVYSSQVKDAERSIELLQKQLTDTALRAPASGIITAVYVETGERITPNQRVVSLTSEDNYELELYIAEENILDISVGLPIEFRLDAFPSEQKFQAVVKSIEPAATIIENEVYYKVKGEIQSNISGMREGMTADVDIIINQKNGVLFVPDEAVKKVEGQNTLLVDRGFLNKQTMPVETGIVGGGFIEIQKGINEGEKIITER